jgi:hypothetical protein
MYMKKAGGGQFGGPAAALPLIDGLGMGVRRGRAVSERSKQHYCYQLSNHRLSSHHDQQQK